MRSINGFRAAVDRLRRERALSLADLAARTGYSASYLSKLFNGHRRLVPAVVRDLDAVLRADGELERVAREQDEARRRPPRPMQLPPRPDELVGREDQMQQLDAALLTQARSGTPRIAVIEGGFWAGKTALAVHWAARVQHGFSGGVLFADLHGLAAGSPSDPGEVLDAFLHALGGGDDAVHGSLEERAARYRSLSAERAVVVVLDNIADYDQVRCLLPGGGSVAVVTSREHQAALLLHAGGFQLELDPLAEKDAVSLLRERVGTARVDVDVDAARAVVRQCGRLPMTVLVAAEHLQRHHPGSLGDFAGELADDTRRLAVFSSVEPGVNIHGVLDVSYLALPATARRVFRLLGSLAAPISTDALVAVADLPVTTVHDTLALLRRAHLLEASSTGRLRMNHLLRAYARHRTANEDHPREVTRARARVVHWYAATAWAASNALAPEWAGTALTPPPAEPGSAPLVFAGYDDALRWCQVEIDTALELARHTDAQHPDVAWQITSYFLPYFYVAKQWALWLSSATTGLAIAEQHGRDAGVAWSLHVLGRAEYEIGRFDDAARSLRESLRRHLERGDDERVLGWVAYSLGMTHLDSDDLAAAAERLADADAWFAAQGYTFGRAFVATAWAQLHTETGELDRATDTSRAALAHAHDADSAPVLGRACHHHAVVLLRQSRYREALPHLDRALTLRRRGGERWAEAETLTELGNALAELGHRDRARESYREAAAILDTLHDPHALDLHARIAHLTGHHDT